MNILIFGTASNTRSPDQQGQAELFLQLNHKVFLLTLGKDDVLHRNFRALGAEAYSSVHKTGRSVFFFIRQAIYFARFCRKHKIDVAFCHLQGNALIGGMAKYFIKTRIVYVRHHTDEYKVMGGAKDLWIGKMANRLSPRIIAISEKVKEELLKDGVKPEKIFRINLCYNFEEFLKTDVKEDPVVIRDKFSSPFVLLCIARLFKTKRQLIAFEAVRLVTEMGLECTLVCIGTGEMQEELQQWINDNNMQHKINIIGFRPNVADYIEAVDMLIQPSESEASNQVVKEAGILKKPAIMCHSVGDFDDYIVDKKNGFLMNKENPLPEMVSLLSELITDKERVKKAGEAIHDTIINTFGIDNAKEKYMALLKN
ncbi:MAG: glycosyltransferase family 4 protein [Ferruginibacter sp.]